MSKATLKQRVCCMSRVCKPFESSTTAGELPAHLPIWETSLASKETVARRTRCTGKA